MARKKEDDHRTAGREIWRRTCGEQDTTRVLEEDGGGSTKS